MSESPRPDAHRVSPAPASSPLRRLIESLQQTLEARGPVFRAMLWTTLAGILLNLLNALMRTVALGLDPVQTMFLRYAAGFLLMLPLALRSGLTQYRTGDLRGHLLRGLVHVAGLVMWFTALPRVSLADTTAIGFTTPIFLMIGAGLLLGERMLAARWVAAGVGFAGVLVVVGPGLTGAGGFYSLLMLASAPVFAASMLMSKTLARRDGPAVIVLWQALMVTVLALPLALAHWQPVALYQALLLVLCGVLGNVGHYCMTRSFYKTDISATQSIKFLDLVWASFFGLVFFGEIPTQTTLLGSLVILAATLWIARREARERRA